MQSVFGSDYASLYDRFYTGKDYVAECDLIERMARDHGVKPMRSILDLGCGTGSHALILAERGYEVVGVDRSMDMLSQARAKMVGRGFNADFHWDDIRTMNLDRKFDIVVMMFSVIGYQLDNRSVTATLLTAARHLNPGGLFIFDFWYGPAVVHLQPSERAQVIPSSGGHIVRVGSGTLDIGNQTCTVEYRLWQFCDDRVVVAASETHKVRFFFPMELRLLLDAAGFSCVRMGKFPEFCKDPDETTWNAMIVARLESSIGSLS